MKQYNEIHCQLGNDEKGNRAWVGGKKVGQKSLDEKTAADLNAQTVNTGIRYELTTEEDKAGPDLSGGENSGGEITGENPNSGSSADAQRSNEEQLNAGTMVNHTVTQEDIDSKPEWLTDDMVIDQIVQIPTPAAA